MDNITYRSAQEEFALFRPISLKTHRTSLLAGTAVAALVLAGCNSAKEVSYKSGGMTHTVAEGENAVPKDLAGLVFTGATPVGSVAAEGANQEFSKFMN